MSAACTTPGTSTLLEKSRHALSLTDVRCAGLDTPRSTEESTRGFELVLVRRGVMLREYRSRQVLMRPGSLMLFEREQPYRITHPAPGGDRCAVVSVPRPLLAEVAPALHEATPGTTAIRDSAILDSRSWLALRVGVEAAQLGDSLGGEERLVRLLPALLTRLDAPDVASTTRPTEGTQPRAIELAAEVIELICRRSSDPLSLRLIGELVQVSPFHLSRVVHAVAGAPIHRILVSYRLQEGVERILDGEDNLSRLALDLGFSSHSHFTASFRSLFGMTPRAFRASLPLVRASTVRAVRRRARHRLPRWAP